MHVLKRKYKISAQNSNHMPLMHGNKFTFSFKPFGAEKNNFKHSTLFTSFFKSIYGEMSVSN